MEGEGTGDVKGEVYIVVPPPHTHPKDMSKSKTIISEEKKYVSYY